MILPVAEIRSENGSDGLRSGTEVEVHEGRSEVADAKYRFTVPAIRRQRVAPWGERGGHRRVVKGVTAQASFREVGLLQT